MPRQTDEEIAALEWLDGATHPLMSEEDDVRHTNTIKRMLQQRHRDGPWTPSGCPTCGIGGDGKPMAYACQRNDCPTRAS